MKRKTTILLSSILAGSLLVGGAFAAYAVTDKASPRVITVTPGTPVIPDKEVELNWGDNSTHQETISGLAANVLVRAAHVSLKASVDYTGKFSVALANQSEAHDGQNLIDNLEVYVYQGNVQLDDEGKIPTEAVKKGEITKETEKEEGIKNWSTLVPVTSQTTPDYSVFVRIVVDEDKFGQLSNDQVTVTLDWGKGSDEDYYVEDATPTTDAGYYLVGSFNNWGTFSEYKFAETLTVGELRVNDVTLAATDEFKVKQLTTGDAVWFPSYGDNLTVPAGKYDILFSATYRSDWETGATYEGMFGKVGYFWFIPYGDTPVDPTYPVITSQYALVDDQLALVAELAKDPEKNEYVATAVEFKAGDKFRLYNGDTHATWTVNIDGYSFGGSSAEDTAYTAYVIKSGDYYVAQQAFSGDIYFKPVFENDLVYMALHA